MRAQIKTYFETTTDENTNSDDVDFIGKFFFLLHQLNSSDQMKKTEALLSIQGMWENFTSICKFQPPPLSKPVSSPKIQNPKLATANKRKNIVIDYEGFILSSKSAKNQKSSNNNAPKFENDNNFETLSNKSDNCEDMDNNSNTPPPEPKPLPIFMKLVDNFIEIISFLEN